MWRTTWSLRGSYPLVTWPATLVSRGRHAERALECNAPICAPKKDSSTSPPGSAGVQRGYKRSAGCWLPQFPFKPASVTDPTHIGSANPTPSATPATPSDATYTTYTMPKHAAKSNNKPFKPPTVVETASSPTPTSNNGDEDETPHIILDDEGATLVPPPASPAAPAHPPPPTQPPAQSDVSEQDDGSEEEEEEAERLGARKRRKKNPSVLLSDESERFVAQWLETEGEFIYNKGMSAYKDKQ